MSYSEWMEYNSTVIDERAAVIATIVVLVAGLIIMLVRNRKILLRLKETFLITKRAESDTKPILMRVVPVTSEVLDERVLGGKASGQ